VWRRTGSKLGNSFSASIAPRASSCGKGPELLQDQERPTRRLDNSFEPWKVRPKLFRRLLQSANKQMFSFYCQPTWGESASSVSTCPVRACATSVILFMPRHSAAMINSVFFSMPPSMHAKQPRSTVTVWSSSPPSRTRTQRLLGTPAYHMAPSASMQIRIFPLVRGEAEPEIHPAFHGLSS